MFVIPCHNRGDTYIIDCVESIRKHHPDELIVVVDSDSPRKEYIRKIRHHKNLVIEDNKNKNYCDGALWHCYEKYVDDFYYLIQDSMLVNTNLDYLKTTDVTSFMYFDMPFWSLYKDGEQVREYVQTAITKTKYVFNETGHGIFGITLYCKRSVLDKLKEGKLNTVLPSNKKEMMGHERLWGMCLEQEGYDFVNNSLLGNAASIKPNNNQITKIFVERE